MFVSLLFFKMTFTSISLYVISSSLSSMYQALADNLTSGAACVALARSLFLRVAIAFRMTDSPASSLYLASSRSRPFGASLDITVDIACVSLEVSQGELS